MNARCSKAVTTNTGGFNRHVGLYWWLNLRESWGQIGVIFTKADPDVVYGFNPFKMKNCVLRTLRLRLRSECEDELWELEGFLEGWRGESHCLTSSSPTVDKSGDSIFPVEHWCVAMKTCWFCCCGAKWSKNKLRCRAIFLFRTASIAESILSTAGAIVVITPPWFRLTAWQQLDNGVSRRPPPPHLFYPCPSDRLSPPLGRISSISKESWHEIWEMFKEMEIIWWSTFCFIFYPFTHLQIQHFCLGSPRLGTSVVNAVSPWWRVLMFARNLDKTSEASKLFKLLKFKIYIRLAAMNKGRKNKLLCWFISFCSVR